MKQQDGVMKMAPLPNGITIDAGEMIQLKPGGLHIMFMHLTEQLVPSQMQKVTLMFDGCGALPLTFMVTKKPGNGTRSRRNTSGTHKHQHQTKTVTTVTASNSSKITEKIAIIVGTWFSVLYLWFAF